MRYYSHFEILKSEQPEALSELEKELGELTVLVYPPFADPYIKPVENIVELAELITISGSKTNVKNYRGSKVGEVNLPLIETYELVALDYKFVTQVKYYVEEVNYPVFGGVYVSQVELFDAHGYPTEEILKVIQNCKGNLEGMASLLKKVWREPGRITFEVNEDGRIMQLLTKGLSGNESIIRALGKNKLFWLKYWSSSHRGGKYVFDSL